MSNDNNINNITNLNTNISQKTKLDIKIEHVFDTKDIISFIQHMLDLKPRNTFHIVRRGTYLPIVEEVVFKSRYDPVVVQKMIYDWLNIPERKRNFQPHGE